MPGHLLEALARRCGHLDQTLPRLRFETARIETPGLCRLPAFPQEQIRQVARLTSAVHEEEFLLEAYPSNREPRAPSSSKRSFANPTGRDLFALSGPSMLGLSASISIWHLSLVAVNPTRHHAGRIAIDLRMYSSIPTFIDDDDEHEELHDVHQLLFVFIQSRTLGITCCARLRNSR